MNLTGYLQSAYAYRTGRSKLSPTADFIAAVETDGDMRAEMTAKRATLTDDVCVKCFCSRIHRDVIDDVLRQTA